MPDALLGLSPSAHAVELGATSAFCTTSSCGGHKCRDASIFICKLACTAYFQPAPDFSESLTGAIADDGFCSPPSSPPTECPPGYTHDPANSWPSGPCKACPEGKYKEVPGTAACSDCPEGKYSSTCGSAQCANMTVRPCECAESGYAVKTRVCIDGIPESVPRPPWHKANQHKINRNKRTIHISAWNVGCLHASNSSNVSTCRLKCEENADASYMVPFHNRPQGCCGYKGTVMPGTEQLFQKQESGFQTKRYTPIYKPKP